MSVMAERILTEIKTNLRQPIMKNRTVKSSNLKQMVIVMGLAALGLSAPSLSAQGDINAVGTVLRGANNKDTRQALRLSGNRLQRDEVSITEQENTGAQERLSSDPNRPQEGQPNRSQAGQMRLPRGTSSQGTLGEVHKKDYLEFMKLMTKLGRKIIEMKHICRFEIDERSTKYLEDEIMGLELEKQIATFEYRLKHERMNDKLREKLIADIKGSENSLEQLRLRYKYPLVPCWDYYPYRFHHHVEIVMLIREIETVKHILSSHIDERSINYLTDKLKELETKLTILKDGTACY